MNKIVVILIAVVSVFVFSQSVRAQSIENTGPNSHNNIDQNVNENCNVENNNNVNVENSNNQNATTGPTSNHSNANSNSSSSSSATNNNSVNTDILIDNEDAEEVCMNTVPQSEDSVRPVGGMGGGSVQSTATTTQVSAVPVGGVAAGVLPFGEIFRSISVATASVWAILVGIGKIRFSQSGL